MYYQIFRADRSSKNYKIFSEMLDDFDRQDAMDLHRLVEERYATSRLEGYDLMLWGDLKILFQPDEEDEVWRHQHEYNLISWRLFDSCGIHILLMDNGIAIHMMIEKKYPLTQEMLSKMLSRKLEVDHENEMAFELLRSRSLPTYKMSGEEPTPQMAPVESLQMISTVKLPILKKSKEDKAKKLMLLAFLMSSTAGSIQSRMQVFVGCTRVEGLDTHYDRFQKLISQLEVHGVAVSNEDAN
ncbi:hypothetical protein Tco_0391223 [Tanacetum coccineum]